MLLNPNGKAADKIFFSKDRVVIKEFCTCTPQLPHWNLILSDSAGETLIMSYTNEAAIDEIMQKVRENLIPTNKEK